MKETRGRTVFLSRAERRIGGRHYLNFSGMNGLGISFLGDTPAYLLAIHFGAKNIHLGLISSMLHMTGIILLVIPRLFRGRNVVKVGFWSWMIRGLVCLGYGGLFFLEGRTAVYLIITVYALFCLSRMVGVAMVNAVQKRLTTSTTQGEIVFRASASFQGTSLLSRLISFLILSIGRLSDYLGIMFLQLLGIVANTVAAFSLRKIPNRTRVEHTEGIQLFAILRSNLGDRVRRRILFARWLNLSQHILFGMAIPFLRRSAGLESSKVFLYTMALGLAAFLASMVLRPLVNRVGSRPVLFYSAAPLVVILTLWAVIRPDFYLEYYLTLGFITSFFLVAAMLAVNRLLVRIMPENGVVGFNSMETFVTSVLALILGIGAGALADLSEALNPVIPVNDFGFVFLLGAIISAALSVVAWKIIEPGSLSLPETARQLTHASNIRTWRAVRTLDTTADPVRRRTVLLSLGHSQAPVAVEEIRRILSEPLSMEKGEIITALFEQPRPALLEDLLREASDPAGYHRRRAVFALGAYPGDKSATLLESLLDNDDPLIRSTAAKSLGRIGVQEHLDRVERMYDESTTLLEILDYMIALYHMDPRKGYLKRVFSPEETIRMEKMEAPLFTLVARQFGMEPPLGKLYQAENLQAGSGIEMILEEARETAFLLEHGTAIAELWRSGKYREVWEICAGAKDQTDTPEELVPLAESLDDFPRDLANRTNALAAIYFTYQILTAREVD